MSLQWPTPPPPPRAAPGRGIVGSPLEQRRGKVDQLQALQSRVHRVQGFMDLIGLGTATAEITFPVWFLERPGFSSGWELQDGQVLDANNFPAVHVGVARWVLKTPVPHASYYTGALLVLNVTAGKADQKFTIHWQAEGLCLRAPKADSSGSVDTVL